MAINVVTITQITDELGYTPWTWLPLLYSTTLDTLRSIPYTELPANLVPADEFQVASETSTCTLIAPWGGFDSAFNEFLSNGGTTGTVLGALNGLNIIEQSFSQQTTANYGFGRQYLGPEFGYCIGKLFKEKVYSEVSAQFSPEGVTNTEEAGAVPGTFVTECNEDLIWRSRFERFYLNNGVISGFSDNDDGSFKISVSTNATTTSVGEIDFSSINDQITLYRRSDGEKSTFDVLKVIGVTGGIEIDCEPNPIVDDQANYSASDFFVLSKSWLIQDPYLLDGVLNDISNATTPVGTEEFFRTDQNQIISEGSFTGAYIRKTAIETENDETDSSSSSEDDEEVAPVAPVAVAEDAEIISPSPNTDMDISSEFDWFFYPISTGFNESDIYKNDTRYLINNFENATTGRTEYLEEELAIATDDDYDTLTNDPETSYLKLELSNVGRSTRTNFHDDCLIGSFVISNGKYFEIIGQEGGSIIDVSINDITQQHRLDPKTIPDYQIYQQYGWKTVEWYQSVSQQRFFQGTVTSIINNTMVVSVLESNIPTIYEKNYFNQGAREAISFLERFSEEYEHDINSSPRKLYTKYKGWYQFSLSGNIKYEIEDIITGSEEITITLTEEPTDFSVGDSVYSLFDRDPYPRIGTFNGTHLVEGSQILASTSLTQAAGTTSTDNTARICLDGFWLSPRFDVDIPTGTRFGLCGGRYWGLGERAPDNDNAIVFMRTPTGALGLSSMFHSITDEDWVLFYDFNNSKLCIRRGNTEFSEFPEKYEVSIGRPSSQQEATINSNGEITLDTSQERTKIITLTMPDGNDIALFKVGTDYYGTIICGTGEMKLKGLEFAGLENDKELYKNGSNYVSPVYAYYNGDRNLIKKREIRISVDTNGDPLTVENGSGIDEVSVTYVNNDQTIDNASLFDMIEIDDSEIMIVMGRGFRGFTVVNEDTPVTENSNSASDDTKWNGTSNGVFIIGSKDTGDFWGNPVKNRKNFDGDNQFGLLVMNGVNYCCSTYNKMSEELFIFVIGFSGNEIYFGVFITNVLNLNYKNFKCNPENDAQEFLWRPPAMEEQTFTSTPIIDNYDFVKEEHDLQDTFVKIASESTEVGADVVITNVTDYGVVSPYLLKDGTIAVFYDSLNGVSMLSSRTSGRSWGSTPIILAKDAKAAIYSGGLLFYITASGIESKIIPEELINAAMSLNEGSSLENIESIQSAIDDLVKTSLNTGPVPIQRLSGHADNTGIFHIIYYDDDKRLCSAEGTDLIWKTTRNF